MVAWLFIGILILGLSFFIRLICALFSVKIADEMRQHPVVHTLWAMFGVAILVFLFVVVSANWVHSGPGKGTEIFNNLEQLQNAKEYWAHIHNRTGAVEVTREEIASVININGAHWIRPVAGEKYILNRLNQSPEARLTQEVEGRPNGTIFRFDTNGGLEIIVPAKTH